MKSRLDNDIERLISKHGFTDVIGALARFANVTGRRVLFRRLNKIYEWLLS